MSVQEIPPWEGLLGKNGKNEIRKERKEEEEKKGGFGVDFMRKLWYLGGVCMEGSGERWLVVALLVGFSLFNIWVSSLTGRVISNFYGFVFCFLFFFFSSFFSFFPSFLLSFPS